MQHHTTFNVSAFLHQLRLAGGAIVAALALVGGFSSCQAELLAPPPPQTAREYAAASARYHDPAGRWGAFAATIEATTTTASNGTWTNQLLIDHVRDSFQRTIGHRGFDLRQAVGPSGNCIAEWGGPRNSPNAPRGQGLDVAYACPAVLLRRNYWDFLVGLPMSAMGNGLVWGDTSGGGDLAAAPDTIVFGRVVKEATFRTLQVDTSAVANGGGESFDPAAPVWSLYIDAESYQLVAARFVYPNGRGEWLVYGEEVAFDGFLLKGRQRWYRLDGTTLISVDQLSYASLTE